jgi:pectinesterase
MRRIIFFLLVIGSFSSLQGQEKRIIVATDGSGNYRSVQEAFNAIPRSNKQLVTVYVKKGIYRERLTLDTLKDFVTLIGEDRDQTVLTYNNHTGVIMPDGDTVNTYTSASFFILANNFKARDITFENNAGFTAGQAVAVFASGDKLSFTNCRFLGFQDVLFCSRTGSRQYYKDCYIEGSTDFIFGPSTVVFQSCQIHSKKNSHVTAASTPREIKYGFVFFDCKLTADPEFKKVSLGRPWRPYASVTYIRCEIGDHILPEGWNNWRNTANEQTARYAEYKNSGPGASPDNRAKWIRQLSNEEVKAYTLASIFGDWNPEKQMK